MSQSNSKSSKQQTEYTACCSTYSYALKMDAVHSSETLVNIYQTRLLHIAEYSYPCESLTSHKDLYLCHCIQTSSGTHSALHPVGTRGSFPGIKWPWPEADHLMLKLRTCGDHISTSPYIFTV
jgi:hypothetical protein